MCILCPDRYNSRMGIPALPICKITLKAKKPINSACPISLITFGDHIKKKRIDLNLFQKDVAELIGVQTDSIVNWELNRFTPQVHQLPKIIEFLGYVPFGITGDTFSSKVKAFRKKRGLSQRKLATLWGVDQTTIRDWENGKHKPIGKLKKRVDKILVREDVDGYSN